MLRGIYMLKFRTWLNRLPKTKIIKTSYCSQCLYWELKESLQSIERKIKNLFNVGGYMIIQSNKKIPKVKLKNCYCHKFKMIRSMEAIPCLLYQYVNRGEIDLLPEILIKRQKQGEKSYDKSEYPN